jgi:hypothetical protein
MNPVQQTRILLAPTANSAALPKHASHRFQITDYKMAPRGAPVNGANLGSMGFKLSTKLIMIR